MAPSATFCNIPLSTSVDPSSATSRVSLNWILSAGISAPGSVASGILTLPCGDTGRDWLFFCRETLPHTSFDLSSGSVSPGHRPPPPIDQCGHPDSNLNAMDVDAQPCEATPSQIPHASMTWVQCRRALLHHIATDRTACRALSQDFKCAAEMSKAVLNIFLDADHKQMSTENLSHLAAALNISVPLRQLQTSSTPSRAIENLFSYKTRRRFAPLHKEWEYNQMNCALLNRLPDPQGIWFAATENIEVD
ncbi:hypothetical protein B0H14DRAFT_3132159 [Mycena olivaceomarginata]|nr:hypothetical protein B0H14DRAFT_3132159 [Mycena olivaceomarginata]